MHPYKNRTAAITILIVLTHCTCSHNDQGGTTYFYNKQTLTFILQLSPKKSSSSVSSVSEFEVVEQFPSLSLLVLLSSDEP